MPERLQSQFSFGEIDQSLVDAIRHHQAGIGRRYMRLEPLLRLQISSKSKRAALSKWQASVFEMDYRGQ
jgi:hypothetical protein